MEKLLLITLASLFALCCAKPAGKVSINELNSEATKRSPQLARAKKSGPVLVPVEVVPDYDDAADAEAQLEAAYADAVEAETDREMSYLTDDDWLYVAKIVQDIAAQREEEQAEAVKEVEMAIAEAALDDEIQREQQEAEVAALQQLQLQQLEEEQEQQPIIVLQDDEPHDSPRYIVLSDDGAPESAIVEEAARQAAIESDPLVGELAEELQAEAELRDHIEELTGLIRDRYE